MRLYVNIINGKKELQSLNTSKGQTFQAQDHSNLWNLSTGNLIVLCTQYWKREPNARTGHVERKLLYSVSVVEAIQKENKMVYTILGYINKINIT